MGILNLRKKQPEVPMPPTATASLGVEREKPKPVIEPPAMIPEFQLSDEEKQMIEQHRKEQEQSKEEEIRIWICPTCGVAHGVAK